MDVFTTSGKRWQEPAEPTAQSRLVVKAKQAICEFALTNPYWAERAFIVVNRPGTKAWCKYTSDQGTSTFDVIYADRGVMSKDPHPVDSYIDALKKAGPDGVGDWARRLAEAAGFDESKIGPKTKAMMDATKKEDK